MARYIFTPGAVATSGRPTAVTYYDRATGGKRLKDLYRIDDSDYTTDAIVDGVIVAPAATGLVGTFAGPEGVEKLYAQVTPGSRSLVVAVRGGNTSSGGGGGGTVTVSPTDLPLFNVETYGAVGDNVTDDYVAIKAAWDAMLLSPTGGLLYFPRAVSYYVDVAVAGRMTNDVHGAYAVFRLPKVLASTSKKTYGILGVGRPFSPRMFPNPSASPQALVATSSVLRVGYSTPFTYSSTYGLPSLFGAPDADIAYTNIFSFSNIHWYADGITIRQPVNPSLCAINVETCSTSELGSVAIDVNAILDDVPEPTRPTGASVLMSRLNNNVSTVIDRLLVVGHYTGIPVVEHLDCRNAIILRTKIGINIYRQGAHFARIAQACVEQCPWVFTGYNPNGVGPNLGIVAPPAMTLKVDFLDMEDTDYSGSVPWMFTPGVGAHVYDPNNVLKGGVWAKRVQVDGPTTDDLIVNGASNFNLLQLSNPINGSTRITTTRVPTNPATVAPNVPTIGTATATSGAASVAFTPAGSGAAAVSYTALSSPGGITGTGSSSPISVTGLTNATAYTFTVRANNGAGSSAYSSASNSVTPTASAGTNISDNFDRANASVIGGSWVGDTTAFSIASNKAVGATGAWKQVNQNCLTANVTVEADLDFNDISVGLAARVTDTDNMVFFYVGRSGTDLVGRIFSRTAGANTGIGTAFTTNVGALGGSTPHLKLVCAGSTVTAYVNGTLFDTATNTFTGTRVGLVTVGDTILAPSWNNFTATT